MVGNAITRESGSYDYCADDFNTTTGNNSASDPCATTQCESLGVDIAITLSLMVGVIMVRCVCVFEILGGGVRVVGRACVCRSVVRLPISYLPPLLVMITYGEGGAT